LGKFNHKNIFEILPGVLHFIIVCARLIKEVEIMKKSTKLSTAFELGFGCTCYSTIATVASAKSGNILWTIVSGALTVACAIASALCLKQLKQTLREADEKTKELMSMLLNEMNEPNEKSNEKSA
jgi:hypothetical protein